MHPARVCLPLKIYMSDGIYLVRVQCVIVFLTCFSDRLTRFSMFYLFRHLCPCFTANAVLMERALHVPADLSPGFITPLAYVHACNHSHDTIAPALTVAVATAVTAGVAARIYCGTYSCCPGYFGLESSSLHLTSNSVPSLALLQLIQVSRSPRPCSWSIAWGRCAAWAAMRFDGAVPSWIPKRSRVFVPLGAAFAAVAAAPLCGCWCLLHPLQNPSQHGLTITSCKAPRAHILQNTSRRGPPLLTSCITPRSTDYVILGSSCRPPRVTES